MDNYRTTANITTLQSIITDYNKLLDEFSNVQIQKANNLKPLQKVSNDFLYRTRINNEALIPLLDTYKKMRSGILPIGLLIRSILSDFLTFCYLATFSSSKDTDEVSIQNELNLLERDFLRAIMEVTEIESRISQFNKNIPAVFDDNLAYDKHVKELKELYKHLFKQENTELRFKKPEEFRATTNGECFNSKKEFSTAPFFMTEKYKWERMIQKGFGKYVTVFIAFKFFSQFQHYSPMSTQLTNEVTEPFAFFHLVMAINSMIIVTDMQIQIIDGNESEHLRRLREIVKSLDDVLAETTE